MVDSKVFGRFHNDEYEIVSYSDNYWDQCDKVLNDAFYDLEYVCIGYGINLPGTEEVRKELSTLVRETTKDGVSLLAREISTGEIVGFSFNKLQPKPTSDEVSFFEIIRDRCQNPTSKAYIQMMIDCDKELDLFDQFKTDCLMELMFLGVTPTHCRKSIGKTLTDYTIRLALELKNGNGLDRLPANLKSARPTIVTSLFASKVSQSIGRSMGFEFFNRFPYTDIWFDGKSLAERIGTDDEATILCVKFL
ncbi:uncharacterized protein LOC119086042 [Bradysia coprophila]|uniref:uncharacterized protein LOC119086042 n=1 Tax=Bradysia coprophila TaxID=38358 RepID=UPI00187D7546|nr:uncharacterized protein LOC119086042 [Bradysia coprophila]